MVCHLCFKSYLIRHLVLKLYIPYHDLNRLDAKDYDADNNSWFDRIRGLNVSIPNSARFEPDHVNLDGTALSVPFATNPNAMECGTYISRARMPNPPDNLAWIMAQSPDYGESRALAINDSELGGLGQTPTGWDPGLREFPIGSWNVLIGVWTQNGTCRTYLNRGGGRPRRCVNGEGTTPGELLIIGGRNITDGRHNPSNIDISHAIVYNRPLTPSEIRRIVDALIGKNKTFVYEVDCQTICRTFLMMLPIFQTFKFCKKTSKIGSTKKGGFTIDNINPKFFNVKMVILTKNHLFHS